MDSDSLSSFLDRFPELRRRFESPEKQGEDEVLKILAEVFLIQDYTIPLISCFRSIAGNIVEKAVTLLSFKPRSLESNTCNDETVLVEQGSGIDYFVRVGKGLDLHELASLAFCRALDLHPDLLGSVLSYFEFAPPPFQRIKAICEGGSHLELMKKKDLSSLLCAVRISYRFLVMVSDTFSKLWDWSCFSNLLKQSTKSTECLDILWCSAKIVSVVLKLGDSATERLGITKEDALLCFMRWEKFCQDVSVEKAGWYIESSRPNMSGSFLWSSDSNHKRCSQSLGHDLPSELECPTPKRICRRISWDNSGSESPFFLTSALEKSFEAVTLAVNQNWPVLLYGPSGGGKSLLIRKLAEDYGRQVVPIPMDDQIDGKTLLGSYISSEKPGEFKWQPGSLSQAVLNGYWVVFEDVDKAPSDVHSILLPLLEGARSFVTGHGEEIRVAETFRLFATITTSKTEISSSIKGGNPLSVFWRRVMVGSPSVKDLKNIVRASFPRLEPLADMLVEAYEGVKSEYEQLSGFHHGNSDSAGYLSRFSVRDLLKWCKRVDGLGLSFVGNRRSDDECFSIYLEAVDIFAAFSTSADLRSAIRRFIGKQWMVPLTVTETYHANKPVIKDLPSGSQIGRIFLPRTQTTLLAKRESFVDIKSSLHLLEKLAASVKYNEAVLMVGETGTGKTTMVQDLAMRLDQKLTVLNLSQQSDVADLLGGFKPMSAQFICFNLYQKFKDLFPRTVSVEKNKDFILCVRRYLDEKNWKAVLTSMQKFVNDAQVSGEMGSTKLANKRKKPLPEKILVAWEKFAVKLDTARRQMEASSGMVFSFVEGAFVKALKNGEWILLDEVNLAPPETLQRVIGVLEGDTGSLCLTERGDIKCIRRHDNFRLFACMNPATDAGKRDLPFSLRSRFSEYFVDDVLDYDELELFVKKSLGDRGSADLVKNIVYFYKDAKRAAEERLLDGANQKPQYSLRSLYRALQYILKAVRCFGLMKAVYDGFSMFFKTLLDKPSAKIMEQMILSKLLGGEIPEDIKLNKYLTFKEDSGADEFVNNYILTGSVKENLRSVARAILVQKYPVLLQGPTSSGKTSLVRYLATKIGREFVRINNHEHTDLQEYLGTYVTDTNGELVFNEGVLVRAVKYGYWIVLDELNLAPSDVLEALNRLLDDNRELFVPELQETIQPHANFMLFATQNPPTIYGGRKMLSRAFRNRFVEIHVDDIPEDELSSIVEQRCQIPPSYAKKMVNVMKELQINRQRSKVFAGKHGYITPRDLFRWADRFRKFEGTSYKDLARDGYYLLAERLRDVSEKSVILEVLNKHLPGKLDLNDLYKKDSAGLPVQNTLNNAGVINGPQSVIWTPSMQRLYYLVQRCYSVQEPVLLVGETGGGKTTVCQLLSHGLGLNLRILNCHQYTETSDFLGGFYPIRERSKLMSEYKKIIDKLVKLDAFKRFELDLAISSDIGQASTTLTVLQDMIKKYKEGLITNIDVSGFLTTLEVAVKDLSELHQQWKTIFKWHDGPLVNAMQDGDLFLVDEISLADDSVLERLNSVLEPERTLYLAEKGGSDLDKIVAKSKFLILATMNPGGDFGKKELSPALRNRFTEIWVPPVCDSNELRSIVLERLSASKLSSIVDPMLCFWEWFSRLQTGKLLTVRDLLSWVDFIKVTENRLGAEYACLHGLFLILLDGLNLGSGMSKGDAGELRNCCLTFLLEQMKVDSSTLEFPKLSTMQNYGWPDLETAGDISSHADVKCGNMFGIDPFYIQIGDGPKDGKFEFSAPTTRRNALRVLRAMQLSKPVLLEGSPGVGKTSLIVALGESSGNRVVRINLSEQTDMMDLLGSDLPVESEDGMKFAWSDGILLQALKEGCWVLLDELNLAPQSVLEGLNAILDHRAEVFIPELNNTYKCPSSFRIFACQNPTYQGGGRKGLPKSFLNRFTKVYVDELVQEDYELICRSCFPTVSVPLLKKLIAFNKRLYEETMLHHKFAQDGAPWEFNLRDVIRSCEIISGSPDKSKEYCFLNVVYVQRMRTKADRRQVLHLYEEIFNVKPRINPYPRVELNLDNLIAGNASVKRNFVQSSRISNNLLKILPGIRQSLEAAADCVSHQWLCILVGQASSGKTSLIRLLAELTGNVLNELHLSSGTDISEILGCFEQYNAIRNFISVVAEIECYVDEYNSSTLGKSKEEYKIDDVSVTKWFAFQANINHNFLSCFTSSSVADRERLVNSLEQLLEIILQLKSGLQENARSSRNLDRATKIISKLLEGHQKRSFSAKFEWVSGLLIKAIERGEWIVLENANCCNPTVLDRINSLVEPSGSITVNECGIVDGKPVVFQPHPNFRMFLTVDPSYGEVSRAMRNRGVEIFMMQPSWLLENPSVFSDDEFELKEANRFLVLSGIPIDSLVQAMSKAHVYARNEGARLNISITYLELARWVQLFQQLIRIGNQPIWSLKTSWEHIYVASFGEADGGRTVSHAKDAYLAMVKLSETCTSMGSSLSLPGGWPVPLKLKDWVLHPRECTLKQNCMYVDFLVAQCAMYESRKKRCNLYASSAANMNFLLTDVDTTGSTIEPALMDVGMLRQSMFPCSKGTVISSCKKDCDFKLLEKKLLFAADWAIEQAPEDDLRLYLLWFRKLGSKSQILSEFSNLIEEHIMKHPVWIYMSDRFRELTSLTEEAYSFNKPVPMLSLESVDEVAPSYEGKIYLCNAILSVVGPLRSTYKQWTYEEKNMENEEVQPFRRMLGSLRMLEKDFLEKLVELIETLDFDQHVQTYEHILEDHMLFWNCVEKIITNVKKFKTEDFGPLLVSWRSLLKNAAKLKDVCPRAVHQLLETSKNLVKISRWRIHSEKSLLWDYGGRPALPSSEALFDKQLQLLKFCDSFWPTKSTSIKYMKEKAKSENPVGDCVIEIVATSNSELRTLVVEGISKMPIIMTKLALDEDEDHALKQLDEIYENLKKCFEYGKKKCSKNLGYNSEEVSEGKSSDFCIYPTEILCSKFGFDSWQETLPLIDITSFHLDMELLQELSSVLVVDSEYLKERLAVISEHLKSALEFSLRFSSRPPQLFSPHQKILWIKDIWTSVDEVKEKVVSFVLEMWFRWHQSLWICCPASVKDSQEMGECLGHDSGIKSRIVLYDIPVPEMIVQPVMTSTVLQILTTNNTTVIKNCFESSLKFKVAACSLWRSLSPGSNIYGFLSSAPRTLFQQIIIAHKRAFDAESFEHIKKLLPNLWTNKTECEKLKKAIHDSSHHGLKMSFDTYISPLLRELRGQSSLTDCISNVGRAWLYLGGLRLNLLLSCDDLDPAVKYHCKRLQLSDRISSLQLEIQVRQECNYLAGRLSTRIDDPKQEQELERLEAKRRKIEKKVVFRSNYEKFQRLKSECQEFLTRVTSSKFLWSSSHEAMGSEQISNEASNWQRTATAFIENLSETYSEYIDFVQPVQVAVYEMKLGFSLYISSLMQKRALNVLLKPAGESSADYYNMDVVMELLYTLMKFPLASSSKIKSVKLNSDPETLPNEVEIAGDMSTEDIDLLDNLITFAGDDTVDQSDSPRLKAYLKQNLLVRITHSIFNSQMIDFSSFKILDKVFLEFSDSWSKMKTQVKTREDSDSQQYKFRPRAFKIDSIMELDISNLENSSASEVFLEWKELVSEEEHVEKDDISKEQVNPEEEWNVLDESVLNRVVNMHDELFRLNSFVKSGNRQVLEEERFHSFIDSYTLGTKIIKGLQSTSLSSLDARLAPESLLRLCLEHDQKFASSQKSARRYNFYKDSNCLEMSKLAKILCPLEQHVRSLVDEWENDHALYKILNVIEVILNIPLTTPLAKVLSGLQFLVMNIQTRQENGTKFHHSDQLESLLALVVSWQKMEFGSWPVLLDEVQHQYDINAGKLWFPLYPIILKESQPGMNNNIESLKDFIESSSIGEFRRRLQLLFAFLGQICMVQWLNCGQSLYEMENLKNLYNVIGFYIQSLPRLLEHIQHSRKEIEKELKNILKLCSSWERKESFLSIENAKKTRQKFKKLVQKYNDLLQQPAMLFLNQDSELQKTRLQPEHGQKFLSDIAERNSGGPLPTTTSDLPLCADEDRFEWYVVWKGRACKSLQLDTAYEGDHSGSPCVSYKDGWRDMWLGLKDIFSQVVDYGDIWKGEHKNQKKKWALSEFLSLLKNSGLAKHTPVHIRDQTSSWWFLQPSLHDIQDVGAEFLGRADFPLQNNLSAEWNRVTGSYFKSIASTLVLLQICPHKDIGCEEVDRIGSFIQQLIEIQQKQHDASSIFAKDLKCFKEHVSAVKKLYLNNSNSDDGSHRLIGAALNQDAIIKCMWQQKQLFDTLCSVSHDVLLLLRTFNQTHSDTCGTVKAASHGIFTSIEKFFLVFKNAKEMLDNHLLGQNRVITDVVSPNLFVVSKEMNELVCHNFNIIEDFETHLRLLNKNVDRSSVKDALLHHFDEVFAKEAVVKEEFHKSTWKTNESTYDKSLSELDDELIQSLKSSFEHIKQAVQKLCSPCKDEKLPAIQGKITSWRILFESLVENMSLEHLRDDLLKLIVSAKKRLNNAENKNGCISVFSGDPYKHLPVSLDVLVNFGDQLLQEHLDMHKTVSMMIRVLADVLASLYSKGFGAAEDQGCDEADNKQQDASGTGMGEGVGKKDVSDEITDEDQLLGASNKLEEEQDASGEVPNKNDKGIEMEQDFQAEAFDVSEDSEEDDKDEDGDEEQLESAMGDTGANSEVVDEKLGDKDNEDDEDDENPNNATEKYESGSSVKDTDPNSRELRAKDDSALTTDEQDESKSQEGDESDGEKGNQDDLGDDGETMEDAKLDKEEAFAEPTGLKPENMEQDIGEDMDLDKEDGTDTEEGDDGPQEQDQSMDQEIRGEENASQNDETMEEAETGQHDETTEKDEAGGDPEQSTEKNSTGSRSEVFGLGVSSSLGNVPNSDSLREPNGDAQESNANMAPESNWSNSNDMQCGLAPLRGLPSSNASDQDTMISKSANSGKGAGDQPPSQLPQRESSAVQKNQPNPNRSLGDPLKEWKERVKVFLDLETDETLPQGDDTQDENADEFGYVSEFEKGTSQALGVATSEQIEGNANGINESKNEPNPDGDDVVDMDIEKESSKTQPIKNGPSLPKSRSEDQKMQVPESEEKLREEPQEIGGQNNDEITGLSDDFVSVRKNFYSEGLDQLSKLSMDDDLGKARDQSETSVDAANMAEWRRYEMLTTRLSQELSEQLRLVMDPNLASKFQGDYKTGKRINMKKVIPYIASHYRRDKIWLRRTRPNKRDYQVVIAVDDSKSMSQNNIGSVAKEALVAVCRAMSQLEIGNLAVTKFGTKGNLRLLHDFDQPFTAEAGVKMISSLTFEQENMITDEPVADLLKYLRIELDAAVARARLPSGQNPLEQLVLIIADGNLHENQQRLKRYVKDFLSQKRMVAFLLLDSQEESIVDRTEFSIDKDGKVKKTNYMDSFPFPFYIALRNIEALPRTLADLLRQWFELMKDSRE